METAETIRSEIGKNRIREAFALLEAAMQNANAKDLMIALTTLKADYNAIERKQIIGTVTEKDEVRRREIIYHLLTMVNALEEIATESPLPLVDINPTPLPSTNPVDPNDLIRIVVVSANPGDTFPLKLQEELKLITQAINNGEYRARFAQPDICYAAQFSDLLEALVRVRPHIVHFAGHGDDQGSVVLQDAVGGSLPLSTEQTRNLFQIVKSRAPLRTVVFNICHSAKQLELMSNVLDFVMGWEGEVADVKAQHFAENFYRTLANNQQEMDILYAYEIGRMSAQVLGGEANGIMHINGLHTKK